MKHLNPLTTKRLFRVAGLTAALAFAPLIASAQPGPSQPGPVPSYATSGEPSIQGTIVRLDGKYQLHLRDAAGYLDNVTLHQGTIINPTGYPLEIGQNVTIEGRPDGTAFAANEIDVPAAIAIAPYGYGFGYPYDGTRFGFGFGFGHRFGGWR